MKRVLVGGISHETSTFTPVPTDLESYTSRRLVRGQALIGKLRGTGTTIGGYIDSAARHGFEIIPTISAEPCTSGPTPRPLFDEIFNVLLEGIDKAGPLDGILLDLHGSMVVGDLDKPGDGISDVEGYMLTEIRKRVGPTVPILGEQDIHSNVTQLRMEKADVLIGRRSYPEVDMHERACQVADVLVRIWKEGIKPTMALHQIPMVWGMNQVTAHLPMKEAMDRLKEMESRHGVIAVSIATCYFLADVPDMGSSVYVVTNNDRALAQRYADELGKWCYERRADWHFYSPPTKEAIVAAEAAGKYPAIFVDMRDNTGGGSPGDSTGMLQAFLDAGLKDACVLNITDPEAVQICHKAGVGATVTMDVGAKSTPLQGQPIRMTAKVVCVTDGKTKYDGPMYKGLECNLGPSAHIEQNGVHVILTTLREQPFDMALARSLKCDPRHMRYIGVKSAAHFRAAFEPIAGGIYAVDEPSVHSLGYLPFKRLKRKLYPLDEMETVYAKNRTKGATT